MNFQVPQFIEVEDKIIGPLTFKQFLFIAGGLGIAFILWTYLPKPVAVIIMAPIIILAFLFAFYKVNNRSFIEIVEAAFYYATGAKLYTWQHKEKLSAVSDQLSEKTNPNSRAGMSIPKLSKSKLKDLSWSLDVQEKIR